MDCRNAGLRGLKGNPLKSLGARGNWDELVSRAQIRKSPPGPVESLVLGGRRMSRAWLGLQTRFQIECLRYPVGRIFTETRRFASTSCWGVKLPVIRSRASRLLATIPSLVNRAVSNQT